MDLNGTNENELKCMPKKLYPANNSCILLFECMEKTEYRKNKHTFFSSVSSIFSSFYPIFHQ